MTSSSQCVFCNVVLAPGSLEHVFLAALGGRVATREATCSRCNNAFAGNELGSPDNHVAEVFKLLRNALGIWSGRNQPPPTILRAGTMERGLEYDLGPHLVPLPRTAQIPQDAALADGSTITVSVKDEADAKRVVDIMRKRGHTAKITSAVSVSAKVPPVSISLKFEEAKLARSISKTAIAGACVMYGNTWVRASVAETVRAATINAGLDARTSAGWDYTSPWPQNIALTPKHGAASSELAGFEHMLMIGDVDGRLLAYVALFGGFRFTVNLGPAAGAEPRGMAVNPLDNSRFDVRFDLPLSFRTRTSTTYREEFSLLGASCNAALTAVLEHWNHTARKQRADDLAAELTRAVELAGADDTDRQAAMRAWMEKTATVELGEEWETALQPHVVATW